MAKMVALAKEEMGRLGVKYRVYTPYVSPHSRVIIEVEYESLVDYEKFWAEFQASPEAAAFMEKWYANCEPGGSTEIYTLE
jgi:hypothetical protein